MACLEVDDYECDIFRLLRGVKSRTGDNITDSFPLM